MWRQWHKPPPMESSLRNWSHCRNKCTIENQIWSELLIEYWLVIFLRPIHFHGDVNVLQMCDVEWNLMKWMMNTNDEQHLSSLCESVDTFPQVHSCVCKQPRHQIEKADVIMVRKTSVGGSDEGVCLEQVWIVEQVVVRHEREKLMQKRDFKILVGIEERWSCCIRTMKKWIKTLTCSTSLFRGGDGWNHSVGQTRDSENTTLHKQQPLRESSAIFLKSN